MIGLDSLPDQQSKFSWEDCWTCRKQGITVF